MIARINKAIKTLSEVSFYQVLRQHNSQVDQLANVTTSLLQGVMAKNGGHYYCHIPKFTSHLNHKTHRTLINQHISTNLI